MLCETKTMSDLDLSLEYLTKFFPILLFIFVVLAFGVVSDVDPAFDTTLNARTLVDASVTFTDADDRYYVRLVGNNLTDERYRTGVLSVATLWIMAAYGQPRYFGVEFGTKFDF